MTSPVHRQRIGAYAVIVDDGRLLLVRLAPTTSRPGWWTLPGGGVDHGEHPRDTLAREVWEETGLVATVGDLLDVESVVGEVGDTSVHAVQLVFRATVAPGGEPVHERGGSSDQACWVPLDEAGTLPLVTVARRGLALARPLP